VIGAAVLATGLLLILAGLASTRLSVRVSTGRGARNPVLAVLYSPIDPATWYANAALVLGLFIGVGAFAVILTLGSMGVSTLVAGIGVLFFAAGIEASRLVARVERWRTFLGEPTRPAAHPYRPLRGGLIDLLRAEFVDESRWRDVLYVAVNLALATLEFLVVAIVWAAGLLVVTMPVWYDVLGAQLPVDLGPVGSHDPGMILLRVLVGAGLLVVAGSLSQLVIALHRGVVTGLLCTSETRELQRQVETLRESRSAVLDVEASELSRIERDLHDGAQQRLVMLSIDLGLASERIETDPARARQLILEGQAQARQALAEIRSVVRGIAPSILLDRGLCPALESITGRSTVPTVLLCELATGERLPAVTERTGYYVVAEALANVARHSGARRCEVRCSRIGSRLQIEVRDDGKGGARLVTGGGLAGLANRIAGVDGVFSVTSPPGGPTFVRAEIPIPRSSPPGPQEPR
jgi:signal transduction histidine kinase